MTLTVTVRDNETGDEESAQVSDDDYFLLLTGTCHVGSIQTYPKTGTHVITIKGQRAAA